MHTVDQVVFPSNPYVSIMEITLPLNLSEEEKSLVDMHSVFNVLNVVIYELYQVSDKIDSSEDVESMINQIYDAAERLKDPKKALHFVSDIEGLIAQIESMFDGFGFSSGSWEESRIAGHRDNLRNIYEVIRVRGQEILHRNRNADTWVEHSVHDLYGRFDQFLDAVQKNSHGRYRIVRNLAEHSRKDYLVHFNISSEQGDRLWMPIVFQDVMRDLLANARKYSSPGGRIIGGLHYGEEQLRFVIEDQGIGIPKDEIESSVLYGYRATNGLKRPTKGGGFGLTKAYSVVRRFGGRMWIDSTPNGTRIEIVLPKP